MTCGINDTCRKTGAARGELMGELSGIETVLGLSQ